MVAAYPVDVKVNPNNKAQRYVLWGNGRIDAYGGAVPITDGPQWFDRIDQPVGVALHISNWATGQGQVLDKMGGFQPLNGAPDYMNTSGDWPVNTLGLVYDYKPRYVDWSWNPNGTAQGYVIDMFGEIFEFGGAPDAPRSGPRFATPAVRGFAMQWTPDKRAITLDASGALWADFAAVFGPGSPPYFPERDVYRDLAVTDWTVGKGYALSGDGAAHAWGGAPASGVAGPYRAGADVARLLHVLSASNPTQLLQIHDGGQQYEYVASGPPTVTAGGGSSEVQKVTITGTPTAGSYTLSIFGQTTSAIAYNATAATVQTALRALSSIGSTGVTVTGGPGPGTPWTVTFAGTLATTDVPQMTATSTFTGGTAPTTTVTTTTPGITSSPALTVTNSTRPVLSWVYSDPDRDSQAAWELLVFTQTFVTANNMADPSVWAASALVNTSGINPTTRGVASPVDLSNGTYRMYVRVKDTAGQWSAWSNFGWTQNVPVPATPTGLTATANNTTFTVALSVTATAGSAAFIRFEASDDGGATWVPVRGADQIPLTATTTGTDRDVPLGAARTYRAVAYSASPRTASVPSTTATATITNRTYVLTAVDNPALGGEVGAQEPVEWDRPSSAGVFQGLGAQFATVLSDGAPKGRRTTLHIVCETRAEWDKVEALIEADSTLVYRDQFGEVMYCRLNGDWRRVQEPAAPLASESTPLRHFHRTQIPLVEVRPPHLPVTDELA